MPVTVKFDPNSTSVQSAIIPDATPKNDGIMTKEQASELANVQSSLNPWGDWCDIDLCAASWQEERIHPGAATQEEFLVYRHWDPVTGLPQLANLDIPAADQFAAPTGSVAGPPYTFPIDWSQAAANPTIFCERDSLDTLLTANTNVEGVASYKVSVNPANFSLDRSGGHAGDFPVICYCKCIPIPKWVVQRSELLAAWNGQRGTTNPMVGGGIALLVEHWFAPRVNRNTLGIVAGTNNPFVFVVSAKFRGYGAALGGVQTEDSPINSIVPSLGGSIGGIAEPTAFPKMELSGGVTGNPLAQPAVDFALGDGGVVARVQHLIMIPSTVIKDGNVIDLYGIYLPITSNTGFQWVGAKYKWVAGDDLTEALTYLEPNSGLQLTTAMNKGQPRTTT